jgi:hypothetical protein
MMPRLARVRRFLRDLVRRSDMEREMSDELQFHLARRAEDLAARRGLSPDEAMRLARVEFGSVERYKEEARHTLGLGLVDELRSDLRLAWRSYRKSKAFTAAAVAIMALGIGANTAIFTLIDAILVRELPVERPQELMEVLGQLPGQEPDGGFTNAIWEAVRDHHDVFSAVFATSATHRFDLARGGASEPVDGVIVSGGYFRTLGVGAAAGRLFDDADDHRGCPPVAVLSHAFWRSHFGGAHRALGTTLALNRQPFQVVGVSARGFQGTEIGRKFDVAIPICASALFDIRNVESRGRWWLNIIGRLDPGVPPAQLQARLDAVKPAVDSVSNSQRIQRSRLVAASVATGRSGLRRGFGDALKLLMAGVAIVLLIACANLAGLMMTRAATRAPEMAIRAALGAARLRLLRQVLTESVVVASLGAVVGLLFAQGGTRWLVRSLSTEGDPSRLRGSLARRTDPRFYRRCDRADRIARRNVAGLALDGPSRVHGDEAPRPALGCAAIPVPYRPMDRGRAGGPVAGPADWRRPPPEDLRDVADPGRGLRSPQRAGRRGARAMVRCRHDQGSARPEGGRL